MKSDPSNKNNAVEGWRVTFGRKLDEIGLKDPRIVIELAVFIPSLILQVLEGAIPPDDGIDENTKMPHYLEFNRGWVAGWNSCRDQSLSTLKEMK